MVALRASVWIGRVLVKVATGSTGERLKNTALLHRANRKIDSLKAFLIDKKICLSVILNL